MCAIKVAEEGRDNGGEKTCIYRKILAEDFLKFKFQTVYTRYPTNPRQDKYKEIHTFAHYCESVENQ